MKLGQLKIECLINLFPNEKISYADDDQSIINTLDRLRADPNYSDLIVTMIGSINRAISYITLKGLTERNRVDLSQLEWKKGKAKIDTSDIYQIEESDEACEISDGYLVSRCGKTPKYIIYRKKHFVITQSTSDLKELEIKDSLCFLIPLYVKGELYPLDQTERKESESRFKAFINEYKLGEIILNNSKVESVYEVEK